MESLVCMYLQCTQSDSHFNHYIHINISLMQTKFLEKWFTNSKHSSPDVLTTYDSVRSQFDYSNEPFPVICVCSLRLTCEQALNHSWFEIGRVLFNDPLAKYPKLSVQHIKTALSRESWSTSRPLLSQPFTDKLI